MIYLASLRRQHLNKPLCRTPHVQKETLQGVAPSQLALEQRVMHAFGFCTVLLLQFLLHKKLKEEINYSIRSFWYRHWAVDTGNLTHGLCPQLCCLPTHNHLVTLPPTFHLYWWFFSKEHNVLEKLSEISLPHWSKITGFSISIL